MGPGDDIGVTMSNNRARGRGQSRTARIARWVMLVVAAGVLVRVVSMADMGRLHALVTTTGPRLGWALLPFLVGTAIETWAWKLILGGMGHRLPFLALFRLRLATEPLARGLPAGSIAAEVAKPLLLERRFGVPTPVGAASAAIKSAFTISTAAPFMVLGLVLGGTLFIAVARSFGHAFLAHWLPAVLGAGAVTAGCAGGLIISALRNGQTAERLFGALRRIPNRRFRAFVTARENGFHETDRAGRRFFAHTAASIVSIGGLFFLQWLTEAFESYLVARILGIPMGLKFALAFESVTAVLRSVVFFVPAGLGFQDALQVWLIHATGIADPATWGAAFLFTKRAKELFWIAIGSSLLWSRHGTR